MSPYNLYSTSVLAPNPSLSLFHASSIYLYFQQSKELSPLAHSHDSNDKGLDKAQDVGLSITNTHNSDIFRGSCKDHNFVPCKHRFVKSTNDMQDIVFVHEQITLEGENILAPVASHSIRREFDLAPTVFNTPVTHSVI